MSQTNQSVAVNGELPHVIYRDLAARAWLESSFRFQGLYRYGGGPTDGVQMQAGCAVVLR